MRWSSKLDPSAIDPVSTPEHFCLQEEPVANCGRYDGFFWPKKFDMAPLTDKDIEGRVLLLKLTPLDVFTGRHVALIT